MKYQIYLNNNNHNLSKNDHYKIHLNKHRKINYDVASFMFWMFSVANYLKHPPKTSITLNTISTLSTFNKLNKVDNFNKPFKYTREIFRELSYNLHKYINILIFEQSVEFSVSHYTNPQYVNSSKYKSIRDILKLLLNVCEIEFLNDYLKCNVIPYLIYI